MLKFLTRCIMFIIGLALILDIALPTRKEQLHVDQHTSQTQMSRSSTGRWGDTSYTIHLIGGEISSCSVGYAAYGALADGDAIDVEATRIFRNCIRIARGDEPIESSKYWKWFALACGGLLIAGAVGWLRSDDDDGFGIRLG
jgi:hypothetical protein